MPPCWPGRTPSSARRAPPSKPFPTTACGRTASAWRTIRFIPAPCSFRTWRTTWPRPTSRKASLAGGATCSTTSITAFISSSTASTGTTGRRSAAPCAFADGGTFRKRRPRHMTRCSGSSCPRAGTACSRRSISPWAFRRRASKRPGRVWSISPRMCWAISKS